MKRLLVALTLFSVLATSPSVAVAQNLGQTLSGRILLQVEGKGEAWYVNPENNSRYYLGTPSDAFQVMRDIGLGITNSDLARIPTKDETRLGDAALVNRVAGKILLQVESRGEAWYVNPVNGKRSFLGRPAQAFSLMRELGLGISNTDLATIAIKRDIPVEVVIQEMTPEQQEEDAIPAIQEVIPRIQHTIVINGNTLCHDEVQKALDYLHAKSPEYYDWALQYVRIVECLDQGSGIYVWENPMRFVINSAILPQPTDWLASIFVHEACHGWQYARSTQSPPAREEYYGEQPEKECMEIQLRVLKQVNASPYLIEGVEKGLAGDGVRYWEIPYEDRNW